MMLKRVVFESRALDDLREFPASVRKEIGFQLERLQAGKEANDWKPMKSIAMGAIEIRVQVFLGAWRAICIVKMVDAIYVLHVFQKKTQATSKNDLDIASSRFKDLLRRLKK